MWWNLRKTEDPNVMSFVSMPHAAFYVVEPVYKVRFNPLSSVSMPHAAFYVVEQINYSLECMHFLVSMPHAAFYVVERVRKRGMLIGRLFQCRTRLSMWWNSPF